MVELAAPRKMDGGLIWPYIDILGQSQLIGGVPFWKFSAGPQPPVVGRCGAPTSSLTLEVSRAGHQWKWYRLFGVHFSNNCWTLYLERCWFKQGNPVFCVFVEPWHVWWILFALRCDAGCHPQNLGEELLIFSVSWLHLRLADQPAKKTRPDSDKASGPAPKWQRSSCVFKTLLYVMLCYKSPKYLDIDIWDKQIIFLPVAEGSLEVKLPIIWTDGKAEVGRVRAEKPRSEKEQRGERVEKKEDAGARKGRQVAIHCVFPMICGSGWSKSRLAKAASAEPSGQMRDEQLHAVVARSTFPSQNVQSTILRPLLEVETSKKCMPLWQRPLLEVQMSKKCTLTSLTNLN